MDIELEAIDKFCFDDGSSDDEFFYFDYRELGKARPSQDFSKERTYKTIFHVVVLRNTTYKN